MPKGVYDHSWMKGNGNPAKKPGVGAKISKTNKGRKITWNDKISKTVKRLWDEGKYNNSGKNNGMYGRKGKLNPFHKSNLTEEQLLHHSLINLGKNNRNWRGGKEKSICIYCKKEFERHGGGKFCSIECYSKNEKPKGENSPA